MLLVNCQWSQHLVTMSPTFLWSAFFVLNSTTKGHNMSGGQILRQSTLILHQKKQQKYLTERIADLGKLNFPMVVWF
jgi:hypothetical protein